MASTALQMFRDSAGTSSAPQTPSRLLLASLGFQGRFPPPAPEDT